MIQNLGPYHPSAILRAKREQKQQAVVTPSAQVENSSENVVAEKPKRTGVAGILDDATTYLDQAQNVVTKIVEKLHTMRGLLEQSLDLKLDDSDRKQINKNFQMAKRELDKAAREDLVLGDALFSGRFSHKGKSLKISEKEDESMIIRADPLHSEALGLTRLRVDSLVNSRKAVQGMDKAKLEVTEVQRAFEARQQTIAFKVATIEETEKLEAEAKVGIKIKAVSPVEEYRMRELRRTQERAAEAKGRTSALLINILV
jgi:flagellin-like hook-associated protein FlgL